MDTHAQFGIITKDEVERWANEYGEIKLTDSQWQKVADELEGRVGNFLDNLLAEIVIDMREGKYND